MPHRDWILRTAEACSAIAREKGFDPPSWENFATKVMLVVTELDELVEAVENDGQLEGTADAELADVAIRLFDVILTLGPPAQSFFMEGGDPQGWHLYQPVEEHVWPVLRPCCKAVQHWRNAAYDDAVESLDTALYCTFGLAATLGVDLRAAIEAKMAKNRERPLLNGKVRSEG